MRQVLVRCGLRPYIRRRCRFNDLRHDVIRAPFLITTPVFDYPGQLQTVTGAVAVISSVHVNSVKNIFYNLLFYLIHHNGLHSIKNQYYRSNTPDDSCQLIRQRTSGFPGTLDGLHPFADKYSDCQ